MSKTTWRLKWNGKEVLEVTDRAAINAIDETMAACVVVAKTLVRVRTGVLQGSLRFQAARRVSEKIIRGRWGSFDVNYAIWQEIGTAKMAAKPYLRPAADAEYPRIVDRMRKWMKR